MKEDYLWDKSGSDPDIERLEGLLMTYGYKTDIPARQNVIEFPVRASNRKATWVFALAAAFAMGAVGIGAWTIYLSGETEQSVAVAETVDALMSPPTLSEAPAQLPPVTVAPASSQRASLKTPTFRQTVSHKIGKKSKKLKTNNNLITRDEAIAYNQLLLALSITGSKLQIVKDSVNGLEQNDTTTK